MEAVQHDYPDAAFMGRLSAILDMNQDFPTLLADRDALAKIREIYNEYYGTEGWQ